MVVTPELVTHDMASVASYVASMTSIASDVSQDLYIP